MNDAGRVENRDDFGRLFDGGCQAKNVLLVALLLGDVPRVSLQPQQIPLGVTDHDRLKGEKYQRAVLPLVARLELERVEALDVGQQALDRDRVVFRLQLRHRMPAQLLGVESTHVLAPGAIDEGPAAPGVHRPDQVLRSLDDIAIFLLALAESSSRRGGRAENVAGDALDR